MVSDCARLATSALPSVGPRHGGLSIGRRPTKRPGWRPARGAVRRHAAGTLRSGLEAVLCCPVRTARGQGVKSDGDRSTGDGPTAFSPFSGAYKAPGRLPPESPIGAPSKHPRVLEAAADSRRVIRALRRALAIRRQISLPAAALGAT